MRDSSVPEEPRSEGAQREATSGPHTIVIAPDVAMVSLLGPADELLRTIERAFPRLDVHVRGNEINVVGPPGEVALLERLVDEMLRVIAVGQALTRDAVERSVAMLRQQTTERPADVLTLNILSNRGKKIRPKTLGQKKYVDAIDDNTIVFGIGPAGTGKTYLAVAEGGPAPPGQKGNPIILTPPAGGGGGRAGVPPWPLPPQKEPH